jgi:MFS family permease
MSTNTRTDKSSRLMAIQLGLLFAILYFVQGLADPGEGLIAQPVRSLLTHWQKSPSEIAQFMAIISFPWVIKPLYGLLIDFVPLLGSRRRNYLLLATLVTSATLMWLVFAMPEKGETNRLLTMLLFATLAIAFTDVVADALMVEKGQALGLTGRLQSIQWGSSYLASVLAGSLGGWVAENSRHELGFLICGLGAAVTFTVALIWVRDTPTQTPLDQPVPPEPTEPGAAILDTAGGASTFRATLGIMKRTFLSRRFLLVAGFLALWNFNPFSATIQQVHMTEHLKLSNQQYGHTYSLFSMGAIGACVAYGFLCRRIPSRWLIHLAIAGGVLSTLAYLLVEGVRSAYGVSVFVGFAYMLGNLIQLDYAARACPPAIAGSMFAMLMSVSNLSIIAATILGGWLYESFASQGGPAFAYTIVVLIGSATTGLCWFLVPWIRRSQVV